MKAVLKSLEITPRGPNGWRTNRLSFGRTTLAWGPLGSGKTPVFKALCFALGSPAPLPPEIAERCAEIVVEIEDAEGVHKLQRPVGAGFGAATAPDGTRESFDTDESLGRWLLRRFSVSERQFKHVNGSPVFSYLSVLGPAFIVFQDTGWSAPYVPLGSHQFVKDQREEVLRWALGVPTRHIGLDRSSFDEAKTEQAALEEQIRFKRRTLEKMTAEAGSDATTPQATEGLQERKAALHQRLASAASALDFLSRSESPLIGQHRQALQNREKSRQRLFTLTARRSSMLAAKDEVEAEATALEQNEVAAAAFRALCGSETCRFFRQPSKSYGRRLLYLGDQLKDFAQTTNLIAGEIERAHTEFSEANAESERLERLSKEAQGSAGATVALFEELAADLVDVTVRIERLARIQAELRQLHVLLSREEEAAQRVADLKPKAKRRDNTRLFDAREALAAAFNRWVVALETPNVSPNAEVDDELNVVLGGRRLNAEMTYSGSTRTRLILAFHGALLEVALAMGGNHPPLLLLDAPRQNELAAEHIRLFVARFEEVARGAQRPVQLLLTATERGVVPDDIGAVVWAPSFVVDGQPRFFG